MTGILLDLAYQLGTLAFVVAATIGVLVLGEIVCSRDPMRAAYSIGAARGQVADIERALRDLAKALGEDAR